MKTKVMLLSVVGALALTMAAHAGPNIGVYINTGGGACYRPPVCGPTGYRSFPVFYGYSQPYWNYWGPTVVSYTTGPSSGFSNVSPVMNYSDGVQVTRVPPPVVIPAQPVTVYPASSFGWKR